MGDQSHYLTRNKMLRGLMAVITELSIEDGRNYESEIKTLAILSNIIDSGVVKGEKSSDTIKTQLLKGIRESKRQD